MSKNQLRIEYAQPIIFFLLFALLIALGNYWAFENLKTHEKEDAAKTLVSVGQLKSHQIQSYLAERRGDAAVMSSFLGDPAARNWLEKQKGTGHAPAILDRLAESIVDAYQYKGLLLLDANANIRLSTRHGGTLTEVGKTVALHTMHERTPVFFKIHFGDPAAPDMPVLDTFVPVMSSDKSRAVGMIVMRSPPDFLYRLIQTWPTESDSAESLLVTKDGDDVLFLNELRHQNATALKLRIPLAADSDSPAWPAISAVTGHLGSFESTDYRSQRVLAYSLAVPDTAWSIVVKMDVAEAVMHGQNMQRVAAIVVALFIGFSGIALFQRWRLDKAERETLRQLQQVQSGLLQSEAALNEAQKLAHIGSWKLDLVTNEVTWTDEIFRILGLAPGGVKPDYEIFMSAVPPDERVIMERRLAEAFEEKRPYEIEHRLLLADGRTKWVFEHSVPICDETGKPLGAVGTVQDISERKQAEDMLRQSNADLATANQQLIDAQTHLLQSEKMASIGQLAAGVAHEINNPIGFVNSNMGVLDKYLADMLNLIAAYEEAEQAIGDSSTLARLQAVKDKVDLVYLKEDVLSLMRESQEGIHRVKKIVQDLKDFSRADSGEEWQRADLHQGLNSTLNVANNEIKYKADVKKEYGDLPAVECLPSQLNQVFMNLLVNAAHAIEEHGTITVRTGQQGDEVWVEVADTGKGIAPEHIGKIFDPFFTTKPIGKGTGLGLSLSYGIVQKHHGRFEVESEPSRGTLFRVWLPINQPHDDLPDLANSPNLPTVSAATVSNA